MGRDKAICKDCKTEIFVDVNMIIVKDKLWHKICDKPSDFICDSCMEIRLGRPITINDFKPSSINGVAMIPCNAMWLENKQLK